MNKILMVRPTYFDVTYAINPHMQDELGNLKLPDKQLAMKQWEELVKVYKKLGIEVNILEGGEDLPDMVFSANHGLPLFNQKKVIMGKMAHMDRAPEIPLFRNWYIDHGYELIEFSLGENESFEGMGDALWANSDELLIGGYGFRTSESVYLRLKDLLGIDILTLKLISEDFYHLDTCLCVLNKETVSLVPKAFDENSLQKIKDHFKKIIEIDEMEATLQFAANSFCPDEKHVIVQKGATKYKKELENHGFTVIEAQTSEFIKAGGSVFCMKMAIS